MKSFNCGRHPSFMVVFVDGSGSLHCPHCGLQDKLTDTLKQLQMVGMKKDDYRDLIWQAVTAGYELHDRRREKTTCGELKEIVDSVVSRFVPGD